MRSSSRAVAALALAALVAWSTSARAQQQAAGFDLERLYTSAPGGGWLVMDALDMHGKLGGAVNAIASWARDPLRVGDGSRRFAVVSHDAFVQFGFAATYNRFRLYASFDTLHVLRGNDGTAAGYTFTAPSVDPQSSPDAITHARVGLDARVVGEHDDPFRLGLGAQVWIPGGAPGALRENYLSDGPPTDTLGAYHAMARLLFAGDVGLFTYAGQLGVHLRSLNDASTPESPQGSELLFGAAAGVKAKACAACALRFVVGPEIFGATAARSLFGTTTTALEGLLSWRLEGTGDDRPQLRFKIGVGGGLHAHFGAPDERVVVGVELFESKTK